MQTLLQDLRYGMRMLVRHPGLTLVAVLTLALGIGANTALFTVINGVLLRPLPFRDSAALVTVWSADTRRPELKNWTSWLDFADWRARGRSFERLAAWTEIDHTLTEGDPERVRCGWASPDLFPLLGVAPLLGRAFDAEEYKADRHAVVLSHALWQRRFGAAQDLPGRQISINEQSHTVVGVLPAGFRFPLEGEPFEVWMPLPERAEGVQGRRDAQVLEVIGRLKPNVTPGQAQAELDAITAALRAQYPETNKYTGARVIPAIRELTGDFRRPLFVLLGAVGCVLAVACVNVAGLLLARGAVRRREMAVRVALGAGRWRVIRQLLTESLLLAVAGGVCGVLLAAWGVDALLALGPGDLPRLEEVRLDARVLGFTAVVSLLTGVLFGLAPAWSVSGVDLTTSLKEGAPAATDGAAGRMRSALVVAEIALALVLLAGAGLLVRSFWCLRQVDPGFDPRNVLTLRLSLDGYKYRKPAEWADWFGRLQERLQAIPGVLRASVVMPVPLHGLKIFDGLTFPFEIEGRQVEMSERARVGGYGVRPGYFQTMGIRLTAGRDFSARDDAGAPPVVIVSEEFVRRYLPGENPLGRRIRISSSVDGTPPPWREIIGVAGDVRGGHPGAAAPPEVYTPHAQDPFNEMYVVVKTDADPHRFVGAVRAAVLALDRHQAFYDVRTLDERRDASLARQRFSMLLLVIFAALALLLVAVGLYGMMSYSVAQRTREIGIRVAVGAQAGDVLRLVVGQGLKLALIGVGIGLVAALGLTRLMAGLLFGVSATDPLTFVVIALVLAAVALLACYLPARRATRVDPVIALRCE